MDTRLLRAFVVLADTANYHTAASQLCITQPALTKQIKLLEQQLSITLFERGRHGAQLTENGRKLLPFAQQVLSQAELLFNRASELSTQFPKSIHVGFGISTFQEASFFVARLREHLKQTTIYFDDMPSDIMSQKLENHQLQVAFLRRPEIAFSTDFTVHPLKQETLALAISTSQLSDDPVKQLLIKHPYLSLRKERGSGLSHQIERFLSQQGISLEPVQEASDIQTIIALVAAGVGVSLVPYSSRHISRHDVAFIPIEDSPSAMWNIDVVWSLALPKPWQNTIMTLLKETMLRFNHSPSLK
ncbi:MULTISPECIES: LysR family transcriptional regulator [Providencia]|uniref:LysR family transcriptional regulator n=1 Tax=Providencia TaxID=586 RepID=UPI0004F58EF0|nr:MULTISPECIES: LysR family transcriptional regulator [Providencia]AIN65063.1 bacterial regulatory helix-turn-helix, lysR family protein [Providencia stuartii]APG52303.1 transcriptional regulator [Providencia stuartii]AVL41457.1 LysR family transcriptional regulator [Providencia stuartii]EMF0917858.1 LysR family transcriptional regulator [Providencia stuartii]MBG5895443.1 LysR family transcriptional regulator [Providencia stuartii]